jgi:uncharacterized protein YebE (UPF0316 family)
MMEWVFSIPLWVLCVLIFLLRVCDVPLGTVRTVAIVKGHVSMAVVLGFFELMLWVLAINQVISRLAESWSLTSAYAGGFTIGIAAGVLVERKLAMGTSVVRLLSSKHREATANVLRSDGHTVSTFHGEGSRGPVSLAYAPTPQRHPHRLTRTARSHDPMVFWTNEPACESSAGPSLMLRPVPYPTGWRATF